MCIKNSPPPDHDHVEELQSNRSLMMKEEAPLKRLAARKSRSKTRKPKFLSLRSQLISQLDDHQDYARPKSSSTSTITTMSTTDHHCHHQLNLFPLHPENLVDHQDRAPEMHDDNNVALLFHSDGGATLHGLLTSTTSTATDTTTTTTTTLSSDQEESLSSFPYYRSRSSQDQYYYSEEGDYNIVRTAMRRRERDMGSSVDEKWVCYSELVEVPEEFTSSTSTASACGHHVEYHHNQDQRCRKQHKVLALKLDYQEILNAWSDKGPLYIEGLGESPQRVPDLQDIDHHLFQLHDTTTSNIENVIDSGNLWRVPEEGGSFIKMKSEVEVGGRSREASVLRYKEKRQSRLFSKRIRYQVRKLNAEKRPRMKGRFVKRN